MSFDDNSLTGLGEYYNNNDIFTGRYGLVAWYFDSRLSISCFNSCLRYYSELLTTNLFGVGREVEKLICYVLKLDKLYRRCRHLQSYFKFELNRSRSTSRKKYYKRMISKSRACDLIKFFDTYVYGEGSITWTKANADGKEMSAGLMYRMLIDYLDYGFGSIQSKDRGAIRLIPKASLPEDGIRPLSYPSHGRKLAEYLLYGRVYDKHLFNYSSFGFQVSKNTGKCVSLIREHLENGYKLIWNADLSDAFNGMDRNWIRKCLITSGVCEGEVSLLLRCLDVKYKVSLGGKKLRSLVGNAELSILNIKKEVNKLVNSSLKKLKGLGIEKFKDSWCDVFNNYTFEYGSRIYYIKKQDLNGNFIWNSIGLDRGTPQGGVNSPMLFNIGLECLHNMIEQKYGEAIKLVRYADDYVIMAKSGRSLRNARRFISQFMNNCAGIKLNKSKSYFTNGHCKFLGYEVYPSKVFPNIEELFSKDSNKHKVLPGISKLLTRAVSLINDVAVAGKDFSRISFIYKLLGISKDNTDSKSWLGKEFMKTNLLSFWNCEMVGLASSFVSHDFVREITFGIYDVKDCPPVPLIFGTLLKSIEKKNGFRQGRLAIEFYAGILVLTRVLNGELGNVLKHYLMYCIGYKRDYLDGAVDDYHVETVLLGKLGYYMTGLGFKSKYKYVSSYSPFERITGLSEDIPDDLNIVIPLRWKSDRKLSL